MTLMETTMHRCQPVHSELDDRVVQMEERQRASEAYKRHFPEKGENPFFQELGREALADFGLAPQTLNEARALAVVLVDIAATSTTINYARFLELIEATRVAFRNVLGAADGPLLLAWNRVVGTGSLMRPQCWQLLKELGVPPTFGQRDQVELLLDALMQRDSGDDGEKGLGLVEAEYLVLRARELYTAAAARQLRLLFEETECPGVLDEFRDELLDLHEAFKTVDLKCEGKIDASLALHLMLDSGVLAGPVANARLIAEAAFEDKLGQASPEIDFDRLLYVMHHLRMSDVDAAEATVRSTFMRFVDGDLTTGAVDVSAVGVFLAELDLAPGTAALREGIQALVEKAAAAPGCGLLDFDEVQRLVCRVADLLRRAGRGEETELGRSLSFSLAEVHAMRSAYESLEQDGGGQDVDVEEIYRAVKRLRIPIANSSLRRKLIEMEWNESDLSFGDFMRLVRLAREEADATYGSEQGGISYCTEASDMDASSADRKMSRGLTLFNLEKVLDLDKAGSQPAETSEDMASPSETPTSLPSPSSRASRKFSRARSSLRSSVHAVHSPHSLRRSRA